MKKSTRSAALRQHASAKVSRPSQAAPVAADPVEWSTGDPIMRDAFNAALPKLAAAGATLSDAIAVLRDLSEECERAEAKLVDDLGQVDLALEIVLPCDISLQMRPRESIAEILDDARHFSTLAEHVAIAAAETGDAKVASAASLLSALSAGYTRIAVAAVREGRRHG